MKAIAQKLYTVSVYEHNSSVGSWDVTVVATNKHDAKNIGVDALVQKGLVNRYSIKRTAVHCHNEEIWAGV